MEKQDGLTLPHEHDDLLEFIAENKQEILKDRQIMKKIIVALDKLLQKTENLEELRRNTSLMLSTVKIQQDALIREYRREITVGCLVEMANHGELDGFFREMHNHDRAVVFAEQLVLKYKPKERRQPAERTRYMGATGELRTPKMQPPEEKSEPVAEIERIRQAIEENGPTEYFTVITDPNSYSKTIQNAFNLALAVRMKAVSLIQSEGSLLVCRYIQRDCKATHGVLAITPEKYRILVEKKSIKKAFLL